MKLSLLKVSFLFLCLGCTTIAKTQIKIYNPVLWYVGKWEYDQVDNFKVGQRAYFKQQCSPDAPEDIVNGTVLFENVHINSDRFSVAVEWKDTIVSSRTYYIKSSQRELLEKFGIANVKATITGPKGEWICSKQEGNQIIFIVGNRKTITAQVKQVS